MTQSNNINILLDFPKLETDGTKAMYKTSDINAVVFTVTNNGSENLGYLNIQKQITRFMNGETGEWKATRDVPWAFIQDGSTGTVVLRGKIVSRFLLANGRYLFILADVSYFGKPDDYRPTNPDYNGHRNPVKYAYYDEVLDTLYSNLDKD